jgi:hypothetical protein
MNQLLPSGQQITVVHFASGDPERIACMPNMTEFGQTMYHPSYMRSNDPRAVTCPACKRSAILQSASSTLDGALKRGK